MNYMIRIYVTPEEPSEDMAVAGMELIGAVEADNTLEAFLNAEKVLTNHIKIYNLENQAGAKIHMEVTPDPDLSAAKKEGFGNIFPQEMAEMEDGAKTIPIDQLPELSNEDLDEFWLGMETELRNGNWDEPEEDR